MSSMLLGERITNLMELQNTSKNRFVNRYISIRQLSADIFRANVSQVTIFLCVWQPISTRPATICSVTHHHKILCRTCLMMPLPSCRLAAIFHRRDRTS